MTSAPPAVDAALRQTVQAEGVHVVHVWAPWCDNARNEHGPVWAGWPSLGADSVTFVTIWSDGQSGADVLAEDGVADVRELVVPGPKPEKPGRRLRLLDLPVTWTPTTWVFNRGGLLATAFNHGEVSADQVRRAVADARRDW